MTKEQRIDILKNEFLRRLTEDFKTDKETNIALFDKETGKAQYGFVTLDQIMTKFIETMHSDTNNTLNKKERLLG